MQNIDFENRRIYERVPAKLSLRLFDLSSNRHSIAQAQDISAQGIGVLTDKKLQPLNPLEMWLPILNKGESLYARGKIVWSKMIESNKYSAGVKLEEVDFTGIRQLIWGYIMKI
ncbi:MAG: PilZ domain-containing protein [Candidatus Omnitrophota bacterium]